MPYRLDLSQPLEDETRRIALEQIARARRALLEAPPVEAIHELRKRCKKIRALLRLVRPALGKRYARENRRFRDLARQVSGRRDEQVLLETFDALLAHYRDEIDRRHYTAIRARLKARRERTLADELGGEGKGGEGKGGEGKVGSEGAVDTAALEAALDEARQAVLGWRLKGPQRDAWQAGLAMTYRRLDDAGETAAEEGSVVALHEWRKRVKYHRYHCELLRSLWKAPLTVRAEEAHRLSDLLGDDHDLAMLAAALDDADMQRISAERRQALGSLVARRRLSLQRSAMPLGTRLAAESPKALSKRFKRYRRALPS
ncbi:CHAD domain-containing protein [Salinicola sp. DM10]|uniref:CHAD domain-containing protein n=1 Tax=Salinicola sp. DM10 TaxID=2815721 RepID=UPI001A8ECE9E|nr:CHAD domain-containing protein [Salinicola sp. DM10]MCE3026458.1 CHAD domain-containing protein [Salinicola sp. DM10]